MRKRLLVLLSFVFLFVLGACGDGKKIEFSLNESEVTLEVGDSHEITYNLTEGYEIEFSMSEDGIVSITDNTLTALKKGEVTITATVKGKKISKDLKVTVKEKAAQPVTSITVTGDAEGLVGGEITLTATVLPENATDKTVTWTSSDNQLATVVDGKVTLLKAGTVTIKAKAGEKEATHEIVIIDPVVSVESVVIAGEAEGFIGSEIILTATVLPENATDKTVTWTSSDEAIATVVDGKYHVGTHWFTRGQQTHGVIASHGGNRNGIGIEMNVNTTADIIDTVQRTAKLVANILEDHNLPTNRVVTHNTMDGKGDSYTLNNTVYNGTYYYERFMEYVEVEREILKNYSDATITFSSESEYLSQTGRVIKMPDVTVEVEYTITVTIGEVTKSITLVSVIQGKNTWNQHSGFFRPTQFWAKAGYRE